MECFELVRGKSLSEMYYLGFNGTHFQIFLHRACWPMVVSIINRAGNRLDEDCGLKEYVVLTEDGDRFGMYGCAHIETVGEHIRIEVPAFSTKKTDCTPGLVHFARVIRTLLWTFSMIIIEETGSLKIEGSQQLFTVETMFCEHSSPIFLSVSLAARKYLESLGEGRIEEARSSMYAHYQNVTSSKTSVVSIHSFEAKIGKRGVLSFKTDGNCACLSGVRPDNVDEWKGYYLHSHNVDYSMQQLNLLCGVASVWQMVRKGILSKSSHK